MKQLNKIYILIVLLVLPIVGFAQQLPQFSQYMYNTISINPAYAGSREIMVMNVLNRNQWIGVYGAPVTQTLSAHSSIPGTNLGVGLSVINDKLGYEKINHFFTDVSYKINLDLYEEYQITFGLKIGSSKYDIDDDLFNDPDYSSDPFLNQPDYKWHPNIGVGIYFRGESFYLGLSSPKLFTNRNISTYVSLDRASYFFNGGYLWEINKNFKFKPSFLIKYTDGAPISFDFSSMFFINEKLWLGGSYRFADSLGAIVNFKITKGLSVGYSFEYITSNLRAFSTGSHEIMFNYEFEFPKPRCRCKDLYN